MGAVHHHGGEGVHDRGARVVDVVARDQRPGLKAKDALRGGVDAVVTRSQGTAWGIASDAKPADAAAVPPRDHIQVRGLYKEPVEVVQERAPFQHATP